MQFNLVPGSVSDGVKNSVCWFSAAFAYIFRTCESVDVSDCEYEVVGRMTPGEIRLRIKGIRSSHFDLLLFNNVVRLMRQKSIALNPVRWDINGESMCVTVDFMIVRRTLNRKRARDPETQDSSNKRQRMDTDE